MERRLFLGLILASAVRADDRTSIRGTLEPGDTPVLRTTGGKRIPLEGDAETTGVLKDERLKGADFEAAGEFLDSGRFRVGPIHKKSMWIWKDDQRLMITYWCEVCSIRTYTPGICMCCQEETVVDLRTGDEPGI